MSKRKSSVSLGREEPPNKRLKTDPDVPPTLKAPIIPLKRKASDTLERQDRPTKRPRTGPYTPVFEPRTATRQTDTSSVGVNLPPTTYQPPKNLLDLPTEVFGRIIGHHVTGAGIAAAYKDRLVCSKFAPTPIFDF